MCASAVACRLADFTIPNAPKALLYTYIYSVCVYIVCMCVYTRTHARTHTHTHTHTWRKVLSSHSLSSSRSPFQHRAVLLERVTLAVPGWYGETRWPSMS